MYITYFRSSSFNTYELCPTQYYMQYVLGLESSAGKKASLGTITHKVLEILASQKKLEQDNISPLSIKDDALATYSPKAEYSYIYTQDNVDKLFESVYKYYTDRDTINSYEDVDKKTAYKYVNKALSFRNGAFDPRKTHVISPETFFDLEIDKPWAEYDYEMPDGSRLTGKLRVRGTIDFLSKYSDDIYEIVDYKTGKASNLKTGKDKVLDDFNDDFQLNLYFWALSKLYPHIKQFIVTIFYIAFDRPFTMAFDRSNLLKTEDMIREQFEKIKADTQPEMLKLPWFCKYACHYGKNSHCSQTINPATGKPYTICQYITKELKQNGEEITTMLHSNPNFKLGTYHSPGS